MFKIVCQIGMVLSFFASFALIKSDRLAESILAGLLILAFMVMAIVDWQQLKSALDRSRAEFSWSSAFSMGLPWSLYFAIACVFFFAGSYFVLLTPNVFLGKVLIAIFVGLFGIFMMNSGPRLELGNLIGRSSQKPSS